MIKKIGFVIVATVLISSSCKKKGEDDPAAFDKKALLENFSDNLIAPALNDYKSKVNQLNSNFETFLASMNASDFESVKTAFIDAYKSWQHVSPFDFGPIRDNGLKNAANTYPTDSVKIANNVTNGGYVLGAAANVDAIGLPALDFMFFRANAITYFQNDANYRTYASQLIQKLKTEIDAVSNAWSAYRSTFVNSTGTESTSSFSQLINEYNRDYELAKTAKVGVPIGKQSLGVPLPDYIEGQFSGISFDLLEENILGLKTIFNGGSGVGFDDYLNQLERSSLVTTINSKFDQILAKTNSFSGSLESNLTNNPGELDNLHLLLSEMVVYIKTDMTSAFGVLITYQDTDGD